MMKRPRGVAITTGLMSITNAMGLFDIDWQRPNAATLLFIFRIFIAIGYAVLWFYWQGRNWARWLVMLTCLQCFWNVKGLFHPRPLTPPIEPLMVASEAILAVYLVWYLNTPTVKTWFTSNRAENPDSIVPAS
jgi:hypothetical protein